MRIIAIWAVVTLTLSCESDDAPRPTAQGGRAGDTGAEPTAGSADGPHIGGAGGAGGAPADSGGSSGSTASGGAGGAPDESGGSAGGAALAGSGGAPEPTAGANAGGARGGLPLPVEPLEAGSGGLYAYELTTPTTSSGVLLLDASGPLEARSGGRTVAGWEDGANAWLSSGPGQTYELHAAELPSVEWLAVDDPAEPDSLDTPRPLALGAAIEDPMLFAGVVGGLEPNEAELSDWYAVELTDRVALSLTPPPNARAGLELYSMGERLPKGFGFMGQPGATLDVSANRLEPGSYVVRVYAFGEPPPIAGTGDVPAHAVQRYRLEVR